MYSRHITVASVLLVGLMTVVAGSFGQTDISPEACAAIEHQVALHLGLAQSGGQESARHLARLHKGLEQMATFWRSEDGDTAAFAAFARAQFAVDQETRDAMFSRFTRLLEALDGHMVALGREFRTQADLDCGPILPVDELFAGYDAGAHLSDDFFANKIAFSVLLNFPLTSLDERLKEGATWTRRQWAEARLAQRFSKRIPAAVNLEIARAAAESDQYIAEYNIWMHHLLDAQGGRLFPPRMRLLSHWNLRDQIKADYRTQPDGLARQRLIQRVMERIIDQSIPAAVIDNPAVDWTVATNKVTISPAVDGPVPSSWKETGKPGTAVDNAAEPCNRYAKVLKIFRAEQAADKYYPGMPTVMDRSFQRSREIPEAKVESLFVSVLTSETARKIGKLIEKRLGRKLQPFDIWYDGFKTRSSISETKLDSIVRAKYPNVAAFQADLPNILHKLGFDDATRDFIVERVTVDPSRGAGHASSPGSRSDKAHLRTRFGANGMDYKGYNIAIHEFGHNVEQTFSMNRVDHSLLRGVPNSAFTEALAFVFQVQDLHLLGLPDTDPQAAALEDLDMFWQMFEIAGVSLVDMRMWHWIYDHPQATPQELRDAVVAIAKEVWNTYYAPIFGVKDTEILGIYSHMIDYPLYLPDYPIGHVIAIQIQKYLLGKNLGKEMERMCSTGNIAPDLWMQKAVGSPISARVLIGAAEEALAKVGKK